MSKDITEIVGDLVESLNFKFESTLTTMLVVDGVNLYRLDTCNSYWLTVGTKFTIDISGTDYEFKIQEVVINEYILLLPSLDTIPTIPIGEIFDIPKPTYRHGTARAINEELSVTDQDEKRLFLWLFETVEENIIADTSSPLEKTASVRLFIFAEANTTDWFTENHYNGVIRPLKQLYKELRVKIKADRLTFGELEDFKETGLADWGEFNNLKGYEPRVFDELWSGLEGRTMLNIQRNDCIKNWWD